MEYVVLNNSVKMPKLGYGTYRLLSRQAVECVTEALEIGYRHIDTAQYYDNEHEVGLAVKNSTIPREEIFVTSKTQTSGYDATKRSIQQSMKRFGLDYLDLMLIHWPNGDNLGTYRALVEGYKAGLFRAIGVSNFNQREIDELIQNFDVVPAVDQIETHIFWQQKRMHKYLEHLGIHHESWSPFGEGMSSILQNKELSEIGSRYNKNAAQIALRFMMQSDVIAIPKSATPKHMRENFNIFDFNLSEEDMKTIQAMDKKQSFTGWPSSMQDIN